MRLKQHGQLMQNCLEVSLALAEKDKQIEDLAQDYIFIDKKESQRLINLYGTKARSFLGKSSSRSDLEKDFGKKSKCC